VGPAAHVALVAACLLNVAALAAAVDSLVRSPPTVEGSTAWIAIAVTSAVAIVGLVRDVVRNRKASERRTAG
jgi:uncharacterized membrane protein